MHAALDALRGQGAQGCVVLGSRPTTGDSGSMPNRAWYCRVFQQRTSGPLLVPPIAQGEVRYSAAFEASAPPVD